MTANPEPAMLCVYDGQRCIGHIIRAPFVRIEPERDGEGWLVIASNGHGWILGSRSDALREKRWHDRQWGRA
jgi:hypothetical protein